MESLAKTYVNGTHRHVAPENTLERIVPVLKSFGISRCADVTGLDRLGIPVHCAIRPRNRTLQVSNGKGLRSVDAIVSALMEAIELFHAENPDLPLHRASVRTMRQSSRKMISPRSLPDFRSRVFYSQDFLMDWIPAKDLVKQEEVWIPASAVYLCSPSLFKWTSNGLASGNHQIEATLHALYELIERDAAAYAEHRGDYRLTFKRCKVLDLRSLPDGNLAALHQKLVCQNVRLLLIWMRSCIPVHTFLAVFLDRKPLHHCSTINFGQGTHLSPEVAAIRAVTEAAQTRLTLIHGSREDVWPDMYTVRQEKMYRYFDRLEANFPWSKLADLSTDDLGCDLTILLKNLVKAGFKRVIQADLTRSDFQIPVVKVLVPGLIQGDE